MKHLGEFILTYEILSVRVSFETNWWSRINSNVTNISNTSRPKTKSENPLYPKNENYKWISAEMGHNEGSIYSHHN